MNHTTKLLVIDHLTELKSVTESLQTDIEKIQSGLDKLIADNKREIAELEQFLKR